MTVKSSGRHRKSIFPFCAGLGCGILLTVLIFFPFTSHYLYSHITRHSDASDSSNQHLQRNDLYGDEGLVRERKETHRDGSNTKILDNRTIPIEVDPDPIPVESLDWDFNTVSQRIPAFLSKELKFKKKLFVAVINTSPLTSRISKLIPATWGESWPIDRPGDLTFYSSLGVDVSKTPGFNYVTLAGSSVLQDLPSANMMYQVLRDICSQYIDTHQFYFIVTGNSYVSLPDLLNFTMHLNETEAIWIGHGSYMSPLERYFKNDPEFYCNSGPGFILSRRSMQGVCPHLETCEREYSDNKQKPGYELARCVRRFLNVNCTRSWEALELFYSASPLPDPYWYTKPLRHSLTVHPVTDETAFYVLHQYFIERQLNYTMATNEYYYSIVQAMDKVLVKEGGMPDDRLVLGRDGNANKYHYADVITWEKIVREADQGTQKKMIFSTEYQNPKHEANAQDYVSLSDLREATLEHVMDKFSDGNEIGHIDVGTVMRRVVPGVGYQYMVDVTKNEREIATVCVNQPYERVMTYNTQTSPRVKIDFILPLQDGMQEFKYFMQMFEQACMTAEKPYNVGLLVVLHKTSNSTLTDGKFSDEKSSETLSLLNVYKQKYPSLSLRWINAGSVSYSYIKSIEMAVLALPPETLICSLQLNNQMSQEFLHHIRLNTVQHERLYFPSSFQFFKDAIPETSKISRNSGFWRSFDYNTFCGYKQDIIQACGGDKFTSGEDLFQKALQSGLDAFRAPEYALLSKWQEIDCDSTWFDNDQHEYCLKERKHINLAVSAANVRS